MVFYDIVKCIPVVGTVCSGVEAIDALLDGDGDRFTRKLLEASVGAALDVASVFTAGTATIVVGAGKTAAKVAITQGARVGINAVARSGTNQLTTRKHYDEYKFGNGFNKLTPQGNTSSSSSTSNTGGSKSSGTSSASTGNAANKGNTGNAGSAGGSGDPPKNFGDKSRPSCDQDLDIDDDETAILNDYNNGISPIYKVIQGTNGRPEQIWAEIRRSHIRQGGRVGRGYTTRIKNFLNRLGRMEHHHVSHIIADLFSGPTDRTYNFISANEFFNNGLYKEMECKIKSHLTSLGDAFVRVHVAITYPNSNDSNYANFPNIPKTVTVTLTFPNGNEMKYYLQVDVNRH